MKILERIVARLSAPHETDIWLDISQDPAVLKYYDGGEWKPIAGGGGGDATNAVLYVEQSLSTSQKAQARENIDALGESEVADILRFIRAEKMRREYFTITAGEDGADIMFYCPEEAGQTKTVSVSTDGGQTWTQKTSSYEGTTIAELGAGEKVMLKGTNDAIGYMYDDEGAYVGNYFYSVDKYFVSGNIMSLLYGDSFADKFHLSQENDGAFCYLFSDYWGERIENAVDIHPVSPLVLPATTLADSCYISMFKGCTGLTSAPELPATTLAQYCYISMFQGCTSLTIAPELPATTLTSDCYDSMFSGCTSLTSAPKLPATTLADSCCYAMFSGCTSLTIAPELPATTLTSDCYNSMFYGCTGLTSAPELPATTLAKNCYRSMFQGCTSLNYVKCLATNISASSSHLNWLNGVAATGTFVQAAGMTSWPSGVSGIPSGWTVQDYSE